METWFQTFLLLSAKAGGVILLVLAIRWVLDQRISATLRYALWSLVLIRLALPAFPASPLSLFNIASVDPLAERIPGLGPISTPTALAGPAQATPSTVEASLPWLQIALGIWALGATLILTRRLTAYRQLRRRIAAAEPVRDLRVLALLNECKESLGLSSTVALRQAPGLPGPALVGILKATILLPEDLPRSLEQEELRHVLLHELTHLRRRDGLIRGFARTLALFHWFNPLVHFGLRQMEVDCELACDDAVLRHLQPKERSAYGHTLLFLTTAARPLPAGMGVGMSAKRQLKRRVEMIARYRPSGRRSLVLGLSLFVLLATIALTDVPVLAGAGSSSTQDTEAIDTTSEEHLINLDRAKITVRRSREIGTAMMSWLTEACAQNSCQPPEGFDVEAAKAGPKGVVHWSDCPSISHEELTALLSPAFLLEVPQFDGFGNRLEFCVRSRDQLYYPQAVLGVRSPGRDGIFEGDTYTIGPFPADDVDKDIYWQDGYYLTWPSRNIEKD